MSRTRLIVTSFAVLVSAAALPILLGAQVAGTRVDTLGRGRAIFASTCRGCHTIAPPSQAAPPMAGIAQRYIQRLGSRHAAARRIAEWLYAPSVEKSLMRKDEVERFGVMPHQPLADAGRFSVAAYVVTLVDSVRSQRPARRPR